jgi:uncharacterized protein (DUF983 family)
MNTELERSYIKVNKKAFIASSTLPIFGIIFILVCVVYDSWVFIIPMWVLMVFFLFPLLISSVKVIQLRRKDVQENQIP